MPGLIKRLLARQDIPNNGEIRLSAVAQVLPLQAADDGDDKKKTRNVVIDPAYSGGKLHLPNFYYPVVADLKGVKVARRVKILADHKADKDHLLGNVNKRDVTITKKIAMKGEIYASVDTPAIREVLQFVDAGHEWEASIGAQIHKMRFIEKGEKLSANGRMFEGPFYHAVKTTLNDISFVVFGADDKTVIKVAASAALLAEENGMEFEKWLKAMGLALDDLSDEQVVKLQAKHEEEMKASKKDPEPTPPPEPKATPEPEPKDDVGEIKAQLTELQRRDDIRAVAGEFNEIAAKAISENWTPDKAKGEVELEKKRQELEAKYAPMPALHVGDNAPATSDILEAGLRLGSSESDEVIAKEYTPEVIEKARTIRGIGFKQLFAMAIQLEGGRVPGMDASDNEWIRAAFSTTSLPGILGNTANKSMMQAYNAVPSAAKTIAKKLSANDFKTHTGYRLTGDSKFEQVGPDGELKHFTVGEESFTFSVNTFGRMIGITRQSFVNDDLGVFTELPATLGRGAALAVEEAFMTLVLANANAFFHANNNNLETGAGSALGDAGLTAAVLALSKQTDADGNPVLIRPKYLLVPPELEGIANQIYDSAILIVSALGATNAKEVQGDANTHKGKYIVVPSPYLSQTGYHANVSTTAWYLIGDPADIATWGIAYLNGNESPTVEEVTPDPQYLGRMWRAYLDFGVSQIDPKASVKNDGV